MRYLHKRCRICHKGGYSRKCGNAQEILNLPQRWLFKEMRYLHKRYRICHEGGYSRKCVTCTRDIEFATKVVIQGNAVPAQEILNLPQRWLFKEMRYLHKRYRICHKGGYSRKCVTCTRDIEFATKVVIQGNALPAQEISNLPQRWLFKEMRYLHKRYRICHKGGYSRKCVTCTRDIEFATKVVIQGNALPAQEISNLPQRWLFKEMRYLHKRYRICHKGGYSRKCVTCTRDIEFATKVVIQGNALPAQEISNLPQRWLFKEMRYLHKRY